MKLMERLEGRDLKLFLLLGRPNHLRRQYGGGAFSTQKSIDPYNGIFTSMFEHFVMHALFLDLTSLVHGFHRSKHATTLGQAVKFQ